MGEGKREGGEKREIKKWDPNTSNYSSEREKVTEMFDSSNVYRLLLLWVPIPLLDTPPVHFWNLEMRCNDHNAILSTLLKLSAGLVPRLLPILWLLQGGTWGGTWVQSSCTIF